MERPRAHDPHAPSSSTRVRVAVDHNQPATHSNDDQLQHALELSKQAAKLEQMTEDQLIQEAIRQSMQSQQSTDNTPVSAFPVPMQRIHADCKHGAQHSQRDAPPSTVVTTRPVEVAPLFASPGRIKADTDSVGGVQDTTSRVSMDWERTLLFSPKEGNTINRLGGSLDLVCWPGWLLPHPDADRGRKVLMKWMLKELQWHRVTYTRPGGFTIRTPRYTTTFGRDDSGAPDSAYAIPPKPFPAPLELIRRKVEQLTGARYNSLIVNLYDGGGDSISYHSDDESFLGDRPSIASLTLGSSRDFYLRRKAPAGVEVAAATKPSGSKGSGPAATRPTEKMVLSDGDLLLMRGSTQAEWEHSVPRRAGIGVGMRINMTFRLCVSKRGTDNFLRYNRGHDDEGGSWRWRGGKMLAGKGGI